ncbi:MAG: nucleotidyltransferase family protein [bacterium]
MSYGRIDRYGLEHTFDVHWQISIPQVFANLLSLDELAERAVALPALGSTAHTIDPVHALTIACIHRVAHHHGEERLIWLYDIHLLAGALRASEADQFLQTARDKSIGAVCEQGLLMARARFDTTLPEGLIQGLRQLVARGAQEPSAVYLRQHLRKVDVLVSDLRALPGWLPRFQLLREHVFPPAEFMRQTYREAPRLLLPALYGWRFIEGAGGWFRKG